MIRSAEPTWVTNWVTIRHPRTSCEEPIHDSCAGLNHRSQLVPVDQFGDRGPTVSDQPRNLLEIAKLCPAPGGGVEVRPVVDPTTNPF